MISPFEIIIEDPVRVKFKGLCIIMRKEAVSTYESMEKIGFEDGRIGVNYLVKRSIGKNLKSNPWKNEKEEVDF